MWKRFRVFELVDGSIDNPRFVGIAQDCDTTDQCHTTLANMRSTYTDGNMNMGIAVTYGMDDHTEIEIQNNPSRITTTRPEDVGWMVSRLTGTLQKLYSRGARNSSANARPTANAAAGGGKKSPARGTLKTGPKGGKYYVKAGRKVYV